MDKVKKYTMRNIITIQDHRRKIYMMILLQDSRIASFSSDSTIKIFDVNKNYNCDITINTGIVNLYIAQLITEESYLLIKLSIYGISLQQPINVKK